MDFIFMLTREDQTIDDCLELIDSIASTGLGHIGFKDIGVDQATQRELNRRIKAHGGVSYMEVVSTSQQACMASVRAAIEIGVDRLLGGTAVKEILGILDGSGIAYYPFPGSPIGHPTRLGGSPELVAADCKRSMELGCAGVDLLAYRAIDADPLDLVRAARQALEGELIVAGGIDSERQIRDLARAGVDAFTVGSAVFNGSFSPRKGSIQSQIRDILSAAAGSAD